MIAPERQTDRLLAAIRATTWNAPALISGLITGWIEDGTLEASEENRRRDGAERQMLCRAVLGDLPVVSHRNAGFAWVPFGKNVRAERIIMRLREQGISVSGADPFATTVAVPQALRLAFGGVPKDKMRDVLQIVRGSFAAAAIT